MMMYHHTKFGHKKVLWMNTETLNLCSDLDFEDNNPIFLQDTAAHDDVPSN